MPIDQTMGYRPIHELTIRGSLKENGFSPIIGESWFKKKP